MSQSPQPRYGAAIAAVLPVLKKCETDSDIELAIEILDALGACEIEIENAFPDYFHEIRMQIIQAQ